MTTLGVVLQVIWYSITHPLWTFRAWWGYFQHGRSVGTFADTDFYKFTMGQFVWKYFPDLGVQYKLKIRGDFSCPPGFDQKVRAWVEEYARKNRAITAQQARQLKKVAPYLQQDYIDFLADPRQNKFQADWVTVTQVDDKIEVTYEGPWYQSLFAEVPLMAGLSELLNQELGRKPKGIGWIVSAANKAFDLKLGGAPFAEFGTRRRFSFFVHFMVLYVMIATGALKKAQDRGGLIGTSNVFLGLIFGIKLMGTMAHELFMVLGPVYGFEKANQIVIALWKEVYGHNLGYFLPDTYGSDVFYKQFTAEDARYFTGPRQDSGSSEAFTDQTIAFYKSIGMTDTEIKQKTIVYSDSLNVKRAMELLDYAGAQGIGASFGIGTNFTNDVGYKHPNIVIKPSQVWLLSDPTKRRGCIKLSDEKGKITGDEKVARQIQHWKETGEITWTPLRDELPEAVLQILFKAHQAAA